MIEAPFMVDLYAGRGGASAAMRDRGWRVVRVEIEPRFEPEIVQDVMLWTPSFEERVDLLWASPPCTEFSRESMPWCRTGKTPDLTLVKRAWELKEKLNPKAFVLENVRGAVKYLGKPRQRFGPVYLWGDFPQVVCETIHGYKERLSGKRPDLRSMIPYAISAAVADAIESMLLRSEECRTTSTGTFCRSGTS